MPDLVFFTRKLDEFPCEDSTIRLHDHTRGSRVHTQVDGTDASLVLGGLGEVDILCESESKFPSCASSHEGWCLSGHFLEVGLDVADVAVIGLVLSPYPVFSGVDLDEYGRAVHGFPLEHVFDVQARVLVLVHVGESWRFAVLAGCDPVLVAGLVGGDYADCFGDGCSPVVRWVLGVVLVEGVVLGFGPRLGFVGEVVDACPSCVRVVGVECLVLVDFVPVLVDDWDEQADDLVIDSTCLFEVEGFLVPHLSQTNRV